MTAILVVENDRDTREMLEYILIKEGYEVHSEADGKASLEAAEARPPDLFLLDLMIPYPDGIDVCLELRSRRRFATTPIVMVSAKSGIADAQCGLLAGADDYIIKPFSVRDVVGRVEAAFRRPTHPRDLRPGPAVRLPRHPRDFHPTQPATSRRP